MEEKHLLGIIQKKGNPHFLAGKLIAYATVDSDNSGKQGQLEQLVRGGLLAVQANFVDQRTIRDFFHAEFGLSLEKGIQEIIDQARHNGGLEGALDPEVVKEKMESMRSMEFIPIPAKVAFFDSEEEILERPEDIFYLGHFSLISHAHLTVNAFPILYQAKFREQEQALLSMEIDSMLRELENPLQITSDANSEKNIHQFKGNLKKHILTEYLPQMLYTLKDPTAFDEAKNQFLSFMEGFHFPQEAKDLIQVIQSPWSNDQDKLRVLELHVEKIVALQNEDFEKLEKIKRKIQELQ